ncbi:DUF2017 domain-containing protein [Janibacter sp. GXQ6167]|uniref:DUF2017 domain-containing protein n=1 Tax=Janibacter sp. GXQ6167 TaxID=3240791 RepID=UPI00352373DA
MAWAFARDGEEVVARLDSQERALVRSLAEQVRELVAPAGASTDQASLDPFEAIVAGIGPLTTDDPTSPTVPDELPERGFGHDEDRDPALDRLFPTGHRTDEQEATEFRRLTEASLRQRKGDQLAALIAAVDPEADDDEVRLAATTAPQVLTALTDIRLVMGERLGLRTDADAERLDELVDELDEDDPAVVALMIYDFLTWLQETLAQALMGGE